MAAPASIDPSVFAVIGSTPEVLRALLSRLPGDVLEAPNAEGWSLKDIVAHLLDVEDIAFIERITRMLDENRPFIRSIDPPARLAASGYTARSLANLLDELEQRRASDVRWLQALQPEQLARTGVHDEVGEIYVSDIAHQWAAHDMDHLRQVARMLQEHFAPLMGATRGFYDA